MRTRSKNPVDYRDDNPAASVHNLLISNSTRVSRGFPVFGGAIILIITCLFIATHHVLQHEHFDSPLYQPQSILRTNPATNSARTNSAASTRQASGQYPFQNKSNEPIKLSKNHPTSGSALQSGATAVIAHDHRNTNTPPVKHTATSAKHDKVKSKRKKDPYNYVVDIDPDWGVEGTWDLPYIRVMKTDKILLKKDRRVVFPNLTIEKPVRAVNAVPSGVVGQPRELLRANEVLRTHPLLRTDSSQKLQSLEEVMIFLHSSEACTGLPIFLTMATVHDDLYWQLIENFMYTMVKFGTSGCSLVICVSDARCMELCAKALFPCFDYQQHVAANILKADKEAGHSSSTRKPHVMEQIAQVKLLHIPKALSKGVDVFMLDLDVGFLENPRYMVEAFHQTPIVDIFVQEDFIFLMDRRVWIKYKYKRWFTEPLPNIGLFLCRGNNKTARVFELAWESYLRIDNEWALQQPGKDQNCVLAAMRVGRGTFGLKYAYFSNFTAPLLDKLILKNGNVMELGGGAMEAFLDEQKSIAMHTTCYEKSTKVMGLKASNAFWNPRYYDPLRRTLTKQVLFLDDFRLLDEVRSLVWLAYATGRSVIVPNILAHETEMKTIEPYRKQVMWPGFRVVFLKRSQGRNQLKVEVLEPGFYWRVNRDYDPIPEPRIVYFDPYKDSLFDIKQHLDEFETALYPRVVLQQMPRRVKGLSAAETQERKARLEDEIAIWANDSVGQYAQPYSSMRKHYRRLPSVKDIRHISSIKYLVEDVLQGMRTCADIFGSQKGNRTCFQICD